MKVATQPNTKLHCITLRAEKEKLSWLRISNFLPQQARTAAISRRVITFSSIFNRRGASFPHTYHFLSIITCSGTTRGYANYTLYKCHQTSLHHAAEARCKPWSASPMCPIRKGPYKLVLKMNSRPSFFAINLIKSEAFQTLEKVTERDPAVQNVLSVLHKLSNERWLWEPCIKHNW